MCARKLCTPCTLFSCENIERVNTHNSCTYHGQFFVRRHGNLSSIAAPRGVFRCVCVCGGQPTQSLRASKWFVMSLQQVEVRSHQLYSAFHTLQPMVHTIRINGICYSCLTVCYPLPSIVLRQLSLSTGVKFDSNGRPLAGIFYPI